MPHKDPEKRRAYNREWVKRDRAKNPDRYRQRDRQWYQRVRENDKELYIPAAVRRGSRRSLPLRFWRKVRKTNTSTGCWVFVGAKTAHGYGTILVCKTRKGKYVMEVAHRVSWRLHFGPIPKGLLVCHKCDNPPCIRPDHLFLGTQTDNMRDASKKGRLIRVPRKRCHRGHLLTPDNIWTSLKQGLLHGCKKCREIGWKKDREKVKRQIASGERKSWRER